jgi:hypothetical protein
VSGDALLAIWDLNESDWILIKSVREKIPQKRRPSLHAVSIVNTALALAVIPSRGYADPTYEQIRSRCPTIKDDGTIKHALQVLTDAGIWVTVKRSSSGQKGLSGRAPRRVFFRHDPFGLILASKPTKIDPHVLTDLSTEPENSIQPVICIAEKVSYGEPYMDALHSGDITVMMKDIERQSSHLINGNSIQKKIATRQIANLKSAIEKISSCADTVLENV